MISVLFVAAFAVVPVRREPHPFGLLAKTRQTGLFDDFDQTESFTYDLTRNRTKLQSLSQAVSDPPTLSDQDYDEVIPTETSA